MKKNKKRLLLVNPRNYFVNYVDIARDVEFLTKKPGGAAPVSLATVAALTPPDFEVKIIDENMEPVDFDAPYDLVGITGFITQLKRAREIAAEFSARGIPVVCGGSCVSISPERWRAFADVLIIGEAERIWPQFLRDFLAGTWSDEYRETERFDLSITPVPDFSGFSKETLSKYTWGVVQTSRGCPYSCDYCNVIVYVGRKMRYKPVDTIIREIEQLRRLGQGRIIFLSDDNFSAGRERAKEILRAIRDWNGRQKYPTAFLTQLSIDVARDEEFLELAAEAGLTTVIIGIETPNVESLREVGKHHNIREDIIEDIKRFHHYGILVVCGCMIGFDHDDLSIFRKQVEFHAGTGIPHVQVFPLQAFDATPLKARMISEGRFIDFEETIRALDARNEDATLLNTASIIPKLMTAEQFRQGIAWLLYNLFRHENFVARFRRFFENYESSPVRGRVKIRAMRTDGEALGIVFRLAWYLAFSASAAERKSFMEMFACARRSSHPLRFPILIQSFLVLKTTMSIMYRECPDIESISYPVQEIRQQTS